MNYLRTLVVALLLWSVVTFNEGVLGLAHVPMWMLWTATMVIGLIAGFVLPRPRR